MLRACWLCLVLSFGLLVLPARADGGLSPDDYRNAIELAMEAYSAGDFRMARTRFMEAHRLQPSARTLRALGAVSYELADYVAATEYLDQALRSTAQPLDGALRDESERLLREARAEVAIVELALTPPDARVTVDDRATRERHLVLEPGSHQLEIEADEHRSQEAGLLVAAGERRRLTVRLEREPSPALAAPSAEPSRAARQSSGTERPPSPLVARLVLGLSAGAMAVGAGLLIGAKVQKAQVEDASDGSRWPGDIERAHQRGPRLARAGIALSAAGAVGLALGIALRLRPGARRTKEVALSLAPDGCTFVHIF